MENDGRAGWTRLVAMVVAVGAAGIVPTTAAAQTKVDDAQIAQIVVTANSIDIKQGELARERATDARVKQFAETMISDHTAVNKSAGELVARLGVTPQASDVSRSLQASADETLKTLATKSGAAFDRAYIAQEVDYHRAVIEALDNLLIPSASNAELKKTLVDVRPAFEAHLHHAETLKAALGGS